MGYWEYSRKYKGFGNQGEGATCQVCGKFKPDKYLAGWHHIPGTNHSGNICKSCYYK